MESIVLPLRWVISTISRVVLKYILVILTVKRYLILYQISLPIWLNFALRSFELFWVITGILMPLIAVVNYLIRLPNIKNNAKDKTISKLKVSVISRKYWLNLKNQFCLIDKYICKNNPDINIQKAQALLTLVNLPTVSVFHLHLLLTI